MAHVNQCDGSCVMCRAESRWTPEAEIERISVLESMIAGAGFAISAWFAVWLCWSVGEIVGRFNLGVQMLVGMSIVGAVTGWYASAVWRR